MCARERTHARMLRVPIDNKRVHIDEIDMTWKQKGNHFRGERGPAGRWGKREGSGGVYEDII